MESFWTRDRTHVPCIGRCILNHWTTREVLLCISDYVLKMNSFVHGILKGATIGDNTTIGAGSVVSGTIPANCIAAGNPARVIKRLDEKKNLLQPSPRIAQNEQMSAGAILSRNQGGT